MPRDFIFRDIIAIKDFDKKDLLTILDSALKLKKNRQPDLLQGFLLANCFFEPSTRTRLSFESAMHRLGGRVIGFDDPKTTSASKRETLSDTMKMIEHYADIAVIRHPLEGAAARAADVMNIPVINAGDGANQHPTQTFLDLFSINECQQTLEGLHIAFVGDLKYGRTVHSLAEALQYFNARLYMISPKGLEMPKQVCDTLKQKGVPFSFHHSLNEVLPKLDILYMTRIQEERFANKKEYEQIAATFTLKEKHLHKAKKTMRILHPLPRVKEIDCEVDKTPHAYYFQQAQNGLYTRQALLSLVLGKNYANI